jgi:hypothetical protein
VSDVPVNDESSKREHHCRKPTRMLDKLKSLSQNEIRKPVSTTPTLSRRSSLTKYQYKNNGSATLHPLTYRTQGQDPAIGRPVQDGFAERNESKAYQPGSLLVTKICAQLLKPYPAHVRQVGIVPRPISSAPSIFRPKASSGRMCQVTVN